MQADPKEALERLARWIEGEPVGAPIRDDLPHFGRTVLIQITADLRTIISSYKEREAAARHILPYLRWTIGPESPGHHPTMPSAVAAFQKAFGLDTPEKRLAATRSAILALLSSSERGRPDSNPGSGGEL